MKCIVTIISHPESDGEGTHFKTMNIEAHKAEFREESNSHILRKDGKIVAIVPTQNCIVQFKY